MGKAIYAAAAAAVILAACSSAATVSTPHASPAASTGGYAAGAPNPVPILKLTGCPVPATEKYGHIGLDSDRVADCTFPGGEAVTVFTYVSTAYRDDRLAHPLLPPQDGDYAIRGPGASIIDVDTTGGTGPSPQQIAARVHGTLDSA